MRENRATPWKKIENHRIDYVLSTKSGNIMLDGKREEQPKLLSHLCSQIITYKHLTANFAQRKVVKTQPRIEAHQSIFRTLAAFQRSISSNFTRLRRSTPSLTACCTRHESAARGVPRQRHRLTQMPTTISNAATWRNISPSKCMYLAS